MKEVNNITVISPQKQVVIHRWITVSTLLLGIILATLSGITIYMIYKQQHYARQHAKLTSQKKDSPASHMTHLQQEAKELNKRTALIQRYKKNPPQIASVITALTQTIPQEATIESIHIDSTHKTYTLTVQASHVTQAVHCVALLNQNDAFENSTLTSLHTSDNKKITAKLQGSLGTLK